MIVKTKTPIKKKTLKPVQKFVRIQIDPKLESILQQYEQKYQLLNRPDIVKIIISETLFFKKQQLKDIFQTQSRLRSAQTTNLTDEEVDTILASEL